MKEKPPAHFTVEAEAAGCLCYAIQTRHGWSTNRPDACPVHGWRPDATPERIAECKREKERFKVGTNEYIRFKAAQEGGGE